MIPNFLRSPDPDRDPDYLRRAAYAYPSSCRQREDRPLILNEGSIYAEPLTVEVALEWAERLADERLP